VLASTATALAISEDSTTILVGNTQNLFQSVVGVWGLSGSIWTKQQELVSTDGQGWFGQSVAIRGTTALVGSIHGSYYGGEAYFFGPGTVVPAMGKKTTVLAALLLLLGAGVVKGASRRRTRGAYTL
jgi:hypothetical protein